MSDHRQQPASERRHVSPPPAGSDRVSDLLFQFESRHASPARRRLQAWWRGARRLVISLVIAAGMFTLGAAAAREPGLEFLTVTLEKDLRKARSMLTARNGELELARLELQRLSAIVEYSKTHRIPADLAMAIHDIARAEGIDPALAFSLVRVESGFSRRAVSSAGAVGFTQVMPSTAFWLQPGLSYQDLFERDTNLRLGFRYLRMLLKQYDGDLHLALLAYNRGPGRVDGILRAGGDPSNGYSTNVRRGVFRLPAD